MRNFQAIATKICQRLFKKICQSWNFKYFKIQLLKVTDIVLLGLERYGCWVLFVKIIDLRISHDKLS